MDTRKILLLSLVLILLLNINLTSAFDFDNVKSYNSITKEVVIKNLFGLGGEIAKVRLNTPQNYKVGSGYQKVAEFRLSNIVSYSDILKGIDFYDLNKKSEKIERSFDIRYKIIKEIEVDDFKESCDLNKTINLTCERIKVGSHKEKVEEWKILDTKKEFIKGENLVIGIFTDVKKGDKVEWIPTLYGVKINEWAVWTEDLNTNLAYYWAFEDNNANNTVHAQVGTNGVIASGNTNSASTTGRVNLGFDFDGGTSDYVNIGSCFDVGADFSISLWLKPESLTNQQNFFDATTNIIQLIMSDGVNDGKIRVLVDGVVDFKSTTGLTATEWNHVVLTHDNGVSTKIYINGLLNGSATGTSSGSCSAIRLANYAGDKPFLGVMDEPAIWTGRVLSQSDITQLYNEGLGLTYTNVFNFLNVTLISPTVDANYTTLQDVNVTCYGSDEFNFTEMQLIINGDVNQTNASGINNTNYLFNVYLYDGDYNISCRGYDNDSNFENSASVRIVVNTTPFIEFISPTPVNYANWTETYIPISVNVSTDYFKNISYNLYNVNGTVLSQNYTNETYDVNFTNVPSAHYHYNVTVCTTTNQCNSTETRHINHDVEAPQINLTSPSGIYGYLTTNYSLDLNWSVVDIGPGNVSACWYDYNDANVSVNYSTNHTTFNYTLDKNILTFYCNDTFGNIGSNTTTFSYKIFGNSQTYTPTTTEGNNEYFALNITLNESYTIDAVNLIYNGSTESVSVDSIENPFILEKYLVIPNVAADSNLSFYWSITLTDSSVINSTTTNQTVLNIDIANCTSYTKNIYNFILRDEELQTNISNGAIETAFNLYSSNREELILNFSQQFNNTDLAQICLNTNLTETSNYSLDIIAKYYSPTHAIEYYNILNSSLTNSTPTQNITLYDLLSDDATDFQLTFTGSDFLPVENALVYVERQYVAENTFKTVELPKTDYNGQAVLHLVRNDIIYNLRIVKDMQVVGNFDNIVAFCQDFTIGDCRIELNAFDSVESIFNYDDELGITFSYPTYNQTSGNINFIYSSVDGSTKTVNMQVEKNDIFGNRTICNTSLSAASGSLKCSIDPNLDESLLVVNIFVDGSLTIYDKVKIEDSDMGAGGYLVLFFMMLSFILIFGESKTGILLSIVVSFAGAVGLSLIKSDLIGFGASGLWLITIIIIALWKIHKNRPQ